MGFGQWPERPGQWLHHHHHPWTTAKGSVIELTVPAKTVLPEVVEHHFEGAILDTTSDYRNTEGPGEPLREHGDDMDPHRWGRVQTGRRKTTPVLFSVSAMGS